MSRPRKNPLSPLGQRLEEARKLAGKQGTPEFLAAVGVSHNAWNSYLNGVSWPDLRFLIRLREISDVDLNWLATGEHSVGASPDVEVLQAVIEAIELEVPEVTPQAKAKLIALLYNDRMKVHSIGIEAAQPSGVRASKS